MISTELQEEFANEYYANNARKLRKMINQILKKLNFFNIDYEDFYSLANQIFYDVIREYDGEQDFNGFLYSCLINKFKTEMTRRTREKRCRKNKDGEILEDISIYSSIGEDEDEMRWIDTIPDKRTSIEIIIFEEEENGEYYSEKMQKYLSKLSSQQRSVLELISQGHSVNYILNKLHISQKDYEDCYNAIHSYKNISILM